MDWAILIQAVVQGLMIGSVYGLVGLGLTMMFAVTGLLNFAHGDFMTVAMYLCLSLFREFGLDPYGSVLILIPVFFAAGTAFYRVFFARVLKAELLMVVQMTLGMVFVIESTLLLVYTADFQSVPTSLHKVLFRLGLVAFSGSYMVAFVVGGGAGALLYWMVKRTDFGRQIRAVAQNREAAVLMGINVPRLQMGVFGIAFALLALAGGLSTSILTMQPYVGLHLTLFAFIVFVMGGVGNFMGTLIAGYVLGVADAIGGLLLGGHLGAMVPYGVFVAVLLLKPEGIMGRR
ncbi:MAG: branched-chain amino acid ABC transporter permease [Candidatus Methanomethylicaceae archaeon]